MGSGGASVAPSADAPASEPAASDSVKTSLPSPKPEAQSGSPSSILDAIRAKGGSPAAEKPAAAAPKGGSSVLDAIRAKGKPSAPAAAKPAAVAKATATKQSPARSEGLPSAVDMLKAARGVESGVVATDTKPKPAKPAAARVRKPAASAKSADRRSALVSMFFTPFAFAWWLFSASSGVFLLGCARFMMPNVLVEPPTKFKIGPPTDYPPDTVSTKWKASRGVWIVNTDQYNGNRLIYALASVCTHLGCTPGWLEGEQKYKCPCHGSGFYITGINFEGPAPRPLERVGLRISEDGMLEVDKSKKFQEEMGQWEDPMSFFQLG